MTKVQRTSMIKSCVSCAVSYAVLFHNRGLKIYNVNMIDVLYQKNSSCKTKRMNLYISIWSVTAFVCYLKTPEPQDLQKIQLHIRTRHDQMSNISYQYLRENDLNIIPSIYTVFILLNVLGVYFKKHFQKEASIRERRLLERGV